VRCLHKPLGCLIRAESRSNQVIKTLPPLVLGHKATWSGAKLVFITPLPTLLSKPNRTYLSLGASRECLGGLISSGSLGLGGLPTLGLEIDQTTDDLHH
jgi:hypothetical protein